MSGSSIANRSRLGKRGMALLAALAASVAMSTAMAAGPISNAQANWSGSWCNNVWLGPQNECHAPHYSGGAVLQVSSISLDRAHCVKGIGYYGESLTGWHCAPAGTFKNLLLPNDGQWYRGAIKNNNQNYGGNFRGESICCWGG